MKKVCLIPVFSTILFVSCNSPRYIYSPSPPNNPYFTEKGQSKVAAYYSSGGDDNAITGTKNRGLDVQGAYAISDKWALTAGYFNRKERDVYTSGNYNYFDSSILDYKRNLVDVGGGYIIPLNKPRTVSVNLFAGLAFGKFAFTDKGIDKSGTAYSRFHNSKILKWYAQSSLNAMPGRYFRASFVFKFSFLHYGNIATSYTNDEVNFFRLDRIKNKTLAFFEPAFNMQLGIPRCDWMKIDGGFTFSTDPYSNNSNIEARSFNASIGLCFDLSKLEK
jgi:hypothetical protein